MSFQDEDGTIRHTLTMKAKYPGKCAACEAPVYKGETIQWYPLRRGSLVFCMHCDGETWLQDNGPIFDKDDIDQKFAEVREATLRELRRDMRSE